MKTRNVGLLLLLAAVSACASSTIHEGLKVSAVADPKVNVKGFRTFQWAAGASVLRDETAAWQAPDFDVDDELGFLIENELREKNFRPVNKNPDVFVAFLIVGNVERAQLVRDQAGDLTLENDSAGALIVELMDPTTLKPVWRGAAVAPVRDDLTDEQRRERFARAVHELIAKLPR